MMMMMMMERGERLSQILDIRWYQQSVTDADILSFASVSSLVEHSTRRYSLSVADDVPACRQCQALKMSRKRL